MGLPNDHHVSADTYCYPRPSLIIHWLSAFLILTVMTIALVRTGLETRSSKLLLLHVHRNVGIALWLLTLLRLFFRQRINVPAPIVQHRWQSWIVTGVHAALYGCLLGLPLIGWALTNAHGKAVLFLGFWNLPSFFSAANPDLADILETVHRLGAWAFVSLIMGHALAALAHHYVLKDNTLKRMISRLK